MTTGDTLKNNDALKDGNTLSADSTLRNTGSNKATSVVDSAGDYRQSARDEVQLASSDATNNTDGASEVIDMVDFGGDAKPSDVSVPNLGEETPWLERHLWVLLLPIVALAFLIVFLVKRRKDENEA